jgi:glyoxylase-like metal-dependent hydrolase (beta-lactamase superfamily II)
MTSLVLRHDDRVVLVDPGVSADEIEQIRAASGPAEAVLVTHSDWDHVIGLSAFPEAEVVMGEQAAEVVRSGVAGAVLEQRAREVGLAGVGALRVDRVLASGRENVGPLALTVIPLPGHTVCSVGFHLAESGLFVVGDYLSPIEPPYVEHSVSAYRRSLEVLIDLLTESPHATVIPGHGGPLTAADAAEIAREDLAYLAAVTDGVATGSIAAGAAVPPPRGSELPEVDAERRRVAEVAASEVD